MLKNPVKTIATMVVSILVTMVVAGSGPVAQAADEKDLLIVGDSMTMMYSDEPTVSRGWWSIVAESYGYEPTISAEYGGGAWAKGNKCQGTKSGDRLYMMDKLRPDAVIVAQGFNDRYGCTADNTKVRINQDSTVRAFEIYFKALGEKADAIGLPRSKVYVFTPWGSSELDDHYWVWRAQAAAAATEGFTYYPVRFNDRSETLDSVHPDTQGNKDMAARFIAYGGLT